MSRQTGSGLVCVVLASVAIAKACPEQTHSPCTMHTTKPGVYADMDAAIVLRALFLGVATLVSVAIFFFLFFLLPPPLSEMETKNNHADGLVDSAIKIGAISLQSLPTIWPPRCWSATRHARSQSYIRQTHQYGCNHSRTAQLVRVVLCRLDLVFVPVGLSDSAPRKSLQRRSSADS